MTRRTGFIVIVAALSLVATPSALAGPDEQVTGARTAPAATVKIDKHVRLKANGVAVVTFWARCRPDVSSFELDVSLRQGDLFGSTPRVEAGVVPCDGKPHRMRVGVLPEAGAYVPGRATADIFLGVFDQEEGDLEARDEARVRLCRPYRSAA
jgi:hypothetical protein